MLLDGGYNVSAEVALMDAVLQLSDAPRDDGTRAHSDQTANGR